MDLKYTILTVALICSTLSQAQVNVGGQPYSTVAGWDLKGVTELRPAEFDAEAVRVQDEQRAAAGQLSLYGRLQELNVDLRHEATWRSLPNGDRVARLKITSPGALATELFFSRFSIPNGGVVYVYDEQKTTVLGGFTAFNEAEDGTFTTALILGETCILEYYEPAASAGQGTIRIADVGHAYRMIPGAKQADPCQVDVNCNPEGADWFAERDAVVRISTLGSTGTGWCTGTVMNNTDEDCTPYVLSAYHCADNSSSTHFNNFKFYFRYQKPGCATGVALAGKVMTGCTKRADSFINSNNDGSDMLLLEINNPIPDTYTPYFAGWNNSTAGVSSNGVCIHHPSGDEKKISTFTGTPSSSTWTGSPIGAHWRVFWTGTPNGHGVTEGGSSGSAIFNSSKQVIGTLTGGASFCNQIVPGGQNQPDFYGKMSYHWTNNGSTNNKRVEPWLDPAGTGLTSFSGSHDPCGSYSAYVGINDLPPVASFHVHPSPTWGPVTLEVPEELVVRSVQVLDMAGRVVFTKAVTSGSGRISFSIQQLSRGTYQIRLIDATGTIIGQQRSVRM